MPLKGILDASPSSLLRVGHEVSGFTTMFSLCCTGLSQTQNQLTMYQNLLAVFPGFFLNLYAFFQL
jgi:hypothetical protein